MAIHALPDIVTRFAAYRALPGNEAWGSLHTVLDDGNVSTTDVAFVLDDATAKGDTEGTALARILLDLSRTQRLRLPYFVDAYVKDQPHTD